MVSDAMVELRPAECRTAPRSGRYRCSSGASAGSCRGCRCRSCRTAPVVGGLDSLNKRRRDYCRRPRVFIKSRRVRSLPCILSETLDGDCVERRFGAGLPEMASDGVWTLSAAPAIALDPVTDSLTLRTSGAAVASSPTRAIPKGDAVGDVPRAVPLISNAPDTHPAEVPPKKFWESPVRRPAGT